MPLYQAILYDFQRDNTKAVEYYKQELENTQDDRLLAVLKRIETLARAKTQKKCDRLYAHKFNYRSRQQNN